ncbi:hypothetical protein BDR26DRAFT_864218 [Obelidium mucronatum]|nr:hypothetical protein BDR26DRAFT_864218 [Obelidium mucronatum]
MANDQTTSKSKQSATPPTKWDQKCFIFLTQTNTRRREKQPPQATMKCIQRLLDGQGGTDKTLLYKRSTDFVTVMNEAVGMMESPDAAYVESLRTPTVSAMNNNGSPSTMPSSPSASTPTSSTLQPLAPSAISNQTQSKPAVAASSLQDIQLPSPDSVAEYTAPKDAPALTESFAEHIQTSILAPSQAYLTRIYKPHLQFAATYRDAVCSGKAFGILGRYYDAVVVEQRPAVIAWKMTEKLRGWVKEAMVEK